MWLFASVALLIVAFCLFKFPRQALYVLGGLLLLILVAALYVWHDDAQRAAERKAKEAGVKLSVVYDTKACSAEFPLHVFLSNSSSNVVNSVGWKFQAYISGRSTNIAEYFSYGTSDVILKPQTLSSACY